MRDLHEEGFDIQFIQSWGDRGRGQKFKDLIHKANVIVMVSAAKATASGGIHPTDREYFDLVKSHVRRGGGLFYLTGERYSDACAAWVQFSRQWGMRGSIERVYDAKYVMKTVWGVSYVYTDKIGPSPVTGEVTGLWYPVYDERKAFSSLHGQLSGMYPSQALVFDDPAWEVVIHGSDTSSSAPIGKGAELKVIREHARAKGFAKNPPLFGIRQFGKGRVAFSGISEAYFIGYASVGALEGITWTEGIDGKPSDGRRLFLNALKWLAQPSMKSRGKGGLAHDAKLEISKDIPAPFPPVNWSRPRFKERTSLTGLIGARSAYSSGKGTVAEWNAAARKAGLDFLVFLEELDRLTPTELEKLKQECRQLSDDNVLLVPGFTSENFIGMKNYYISSNIPYPKRDMLRPDGKGWSDGAKYAAYKRPGQLNALRQTYVWNMCATKVVLGYYDFANTPVPYNDCGIYDTVPVMTARGDKLVENALHVYRDACRDKQFPQPIGFHFLSSPEQLSSVDLILTKALLPNVTEFRKWFVDRGFGHRFLDPATLWVTNGPEIVAWDRLGGKDYRLRNPDEFVWQNALNKFRIKVRSKNGLKAVKVWDGDKLFRHFEASGREFETLFCLDKRDQQRELILEVIDQKGKRAISARHLTKNHFLQQVNCGDRNNQLACSFVPRRSDGTRMMRAQIQATPNKRVGQMGIRPTSVWAQDVKLGTGAFDGLPRYAGYPGVSEAITLRIKGAYHKYTQQVTQGRWGEEENGSHQIAISRFSSMDVLIGDRIVENIFDGKVDVINVWRTLWRLKPRKYSTWTQRRMVFRSRGDQPLTFDLWQYRVRLKKAITYEEDSLLGLEAARMREGGSRFWNLGPSGPGLTPVVQGSFEKPAGRAEEMSDFGTGAWAAYTGGPGGGMILFSLSPNLKIVTPKGRRTKPLFQIGLASSQAPKKKGDEASFSVLVVGIPRRAKGYSDEVAVDDPVKVASALKAGLGIGREPSYKVTWQRGTPQKADFFCRVRASDGAAVGRFAKADDLIAVIPVMVEGVNPNWTVMYHERNENKIRPLGQFEGKAIAVIDPYYGEMDLFLGHPVVCDNDDLVIHVVRTGDARWNVELHNPTAQPIETQCRSDADWTAFELTGQVNVPPRSSASFDVEAG